MRTQDIQIGAWYRHKSSPSYGYAKALKIIRPMAKYKQKHDYDLMDVEKDTKIVIVRCLWSVDKNEDFGLTIGR